MEVGVAETPGGAWPVPRRDDGLIADLIGDGEGAGFGSGAGGGIGDCDGAGAVALEEGAAVVDDGEIAGGGNDDLGQGLVAGIGEGDLLGLSWWCRSAGTANVSEPGARPSVAAVCPVPERGAVWTPSALTTVRVPAREPEAAGAKTMLTVQLVAAAKELGQVLAAMRKSPVTASLVRMTGLRSCIGDGDGLRSGGGTDGQRAEVEGGRRELDDRGAEAGAGERGGDLAAGEIGEEGEGAGARAGLGGIEADLNLAGGSGGDGLAGAGVGFTEVAGSGDGGDVQIEAAGVRDGDGLRGARWSGGSGRQR